MTDKPVFMYYCVGLIDLPGQSDHLKAIETLPTTQADAEAFLRGARATVGRVYQLRQCLREAIESLKHETAAEGDFCKRTGLSLEQKLAVRRAFVPTINFQHFSDTVIMYAPLKTPFGYVAVYDIYTAIVASASAMLTFLSAGTPLRGGIELGAAMELDTGDLYGPAVRDAHNCESHLAQYPRIVLGPAAYGFLRSILREENADPFFTNAQQQPASWAMEFVTQDTDRLMIVDFLGAAMRDICSDADVKAARRVFDFATSSMGRYKNDAKLGPRYRRLVDYCESRRSLWF